MKRIIYTLVAAAVGFTACRKEQPASPIAMAESASFTDADFTAAKASPGSNKKNTDNSLEWDYDLVIKKLKNDRYKVGMRVHGLRSMGSRLGDDQNDLLRAAITGIVLAINNTKEKAEVPLDVVLNSDDVNGKVFSFPEFTYKGDLDYELVNVKSTFKLKGGSITVKDNSTFTLGGSTITVSGGNLQFKENSSFVLPTGSTVTVNSAKVETNFAILFEGIGKGGSCGNDDDFFLLPSGHPTEQDPVVKKVTFPKTDDGKVMRITVAGDPAEAVTSVWYTPAAYPDPNNPDVLVQPAPIQFHKSEPSDKKIGICCYDACLTKENGSNYFCGTTSHFKPADFNADGPGWARITLKIAQ
ncbi:MAG: hypothetical protein JNL72_02115 [Flavipsychrobacter sp.]|nr:hypothetical protein [Flavipsychrobacter sp.]